MVKVLIGVVIGVALVVPQTRHEVIQIVRNILDLVVNLGTYLFNLV